MKVTGKTIVVTGAAGGIGGAIVRELLHHGARVAAVDLREADMQLLTKDARATPQTLSLHAVNSTDRSAIKALPGEILQQHASIDGYINCAGVVQPFVHVADLDEKAIKRVMEVNFYGTLYMAQAFIPHLLKRPEAHIVNISSMGGFLPVPGQGLYGASKAAVSLLSESLFSELLGSSIHVTTVYPGATNTQITKNSGVDAPADPSELSIPMNSKERVARKVIRSMQRNKVRVYTGLDSWAMNKLYRLSPTLATRIIASLMRSLLK